MNHKMLIPPHLHRPGHQSGFTLIEVMVASVTGLFIIAVSLTFLNQAAHMAQIMDTRMRLNSQARDFTRLLVDGGGNLNNVRLAGLRGSAEVSGAPTVTLAPSGNTLAPNGQRYQLSGADTGAGSIGNTSFNSDELDVNINCTAANTPHQDCVAAGTLTVTGYLNGSPTITAAGPAVARHCATGNRNSLAQIDWDLIDPSRLQRENEFIAEETSAHFSTLVGLLVDCQP